MEFSEEDRVAAESQNCAARGIIARASRVPDFEILDG
jgi:hypothetical protein